MELSRKIELNAKNVAIMAVIGIVALAAVSPGIGDLITSQGITIWAISDITLDISSFDILAEPMETVSPYFYMWQTGVTQPTPVIITAGTAQTRVGPDQNITWAAGGYGCRDELYYWEKEEFTVGYEYTSLQIRLYAVPRCDDVSLKVFSSYRDLTNGIYNVTLGAGEDTTLEFVFDVTDEFFAIRRPHICADYDTAVLNDINIMGLREVNPPTRIVSSLDQCFDVDLDYYLYNDTRKSHDVYVDVITGVNPSGSYINWYLIDKDLWYKDGELYFVHPITRKDMGAGTTGGSKWIDGELVPHDDITCTWNITTWFA